MMDYYTKWVHQIKTPIAGLKLIIQNDYQDERMLVELLKIEQYVNMALQYIRLDHIHHDLSFKNIFRLSRITRDKNNPFSSLKKI